MQRTTVRHCVKRGSTKNIKVRGDGRNPEQDPLNQLRNVHMSTDIEAASTGPT